MTDTHTDHVHNETLTNLTSADGEPFLIVQKEGDSYYPDSLAYFVGGDVYSVIADAKDTGGAFIYMDFYVPPRDFVPQHIHALEAEAKYILDGQVTFKFEEGLDLTAPAGTFVYYPQGKPMGFIATEEPARLGVMVIPGVSFYEMAGVPVDQYIDGVRVDVPPPQADLDELASQVNIGDVTNIVDTYGGTLYFPEFSQVSSGVPNTILVVPDASLITEELRNAPGISVFALADRPTEIKEFGIEYTSLVTFDETDGSLSYRQFNLSPQTDFPTSIISEERQTFYVTEGTLAVKIGDEIKTAIADTFVYVSAGQSYSIANFGTTPVKVLTATVIDTYIPKIGQYLPGNTPSQTAIRQGEEYVQGNVISTVPKAVGDGWIYTWGAFDAQGSPTSLGVTLTAEAMIQAFTVEDTDPSDGLFPRIVNHLAMPEVFDAARVFDLAFPDKVLETTPFNHMGFYANSQGHAPMSIYDKPHFDVHFFLSSLEDREKITGMPEDNNNLFNLPPSGYLNADYLAPTFPLGSNTLATGDALQGIHWVDKDAPEFNGGSFGQTFIFGSYADKVNFWEPMITREFMETISDEGKSESQTFTIKQPSRFLEQGYYPLEYTISYNHDFQEYTISLDKLNLRLADPLASESLTPEGTPASIIDLRDRTEKSSSEFAISREAVYSNEGGFYQIEDATGSVLDIVTGNLIAPGEVGYAKVALARRMINLKQEGTDSMEIDGGVLLAPYLVANGTVEEFLSVNPTNDGNETLPIAYFAFKAANPDGIEHVRQIGINTFGFEDLLGGGDLDFNDSIVSGGPAAAVIIQTTQIATGNEQIMGSGLDETLYGSVAGTNTLFGLEGDDILFAGGGGSTLNGGKGLDVLVAGVGSDILGGGEGFDQFIFQKANATKAENTNVTQGGYGGNDTIVDFQAIAGTGDKILLRNLDNGVGINIADDGQGNSIITLQNRANIDPLGGSSGTGGYVPLAIQTIKVQGISAATLMTQGRIELNGITLNEGTETLTKAFGTYDYVIGAKAATFPLRTGGVPGNSVFGDPGFGFPGVPAENNLVKGDYATDAQIADLLQRITASVVNNTDASDPIQGLKLPGTDDTTIDAILRAQLEAEKVIGIIPEALLPKNAFNFALNPDGTVDLSKFTRTFDSSTINDDLIVGGPGNDFLIGGPGNDIIVGGYGNDIIWAAAGQDIIVGREGTDYIIFDSILDFRDRDIVAEDAISNAYADARLGYIRLEEDYGIDLTNDFTTKTGPDIILINSKAFNRGIEPGADGKAIDPLTGQDIGYLKPGTFITGDGTGPASTKNGQLHVGAATVPNSDGPSNDDLQPLFYYSPSAGSLFFDRDGAGTHFGDFWMSDMGVGVGIPDNSPSAAPSILIYIY